MPDSAVFFWAAYLRGMAVERVTVLTAKLECTRVTLGSRVKDW